MISLGNGQSTHCVIVTSQRDQVLNVGESRLDREYNGASTGIMLTQRVLHSDACPRPALRERKTKDPGPPRLPR